MKTVEAIYSPVCEASGAFLGLLEEWLQGTGIRINSIPADLLGANEMQWYRDSGLVSSGGRLKNSIFIDLFHEGRLINSVPLDREKIERELGVKLNRESEEQTRSESDPLQIATFRKLLAQEELRWNTITAGNYMEEMSMCLQNYPYGSPPERYHQRCRQLKEKVFQEVFRLESAAGVYASWQDRVIGLVEVFPREILKKYGFTTGTRGKDSEYLTIGCFEVGYGIPRKEMLDELMFQLEQRHRLFGRPHLEGVGVFEWSDGFTPYWVYDKYGFTRSEQITDQKVIMEKTIECEGHKAREA